MRKCWQEIGRLIKVNATHRKGFKIGEVRPLFVMGNLVGEVKELMENPDDPDEAADVFGVLIHYCLKQGWSMEDIQLRLLTKLAIRFTEG